MTFLGTGLGRRVRRAVLSEGKAQGGSLAMQGGGKRLAYSFADMFCVPTLESLGP